MARKKSDTSGGRKLSWIEEREAKYTPNSPTLEEMTENADFGPSGVIGSVARKAPRIWRAASAAAGEGGVVREGRAIWKKLQQKLGSGASEDEVAKAANNYAELWQAGKNSDDVVREAVRATKGEGADRTLRHSAGEISDEVPLLLSDKLNKVKPKPKSDAADWSVLEGKEADIAIDKLRARRRGNK